MKSQEILGAVKAVETALRSVRPGELLLVQADEIDETVNFIQKYLATSEACREIDMIQALEVPAAPAASTPPATATVFASPVVD